MIDSHVDLLVSWLDGVHVLTAQARADELRSVHCARRDSTRKQAPAQQLRIAAAHESAHAVVARAQGLQVGRLVLRADGEGDAELVGEDAVAIAIAQLAGPALELMYTGADESRRFVLAHSFDLLAARVNIDTCPVVSSRAAATIACAYVMDRVARIGRLAAALLALGELTGAEVAALCSAAQ